MELRSSPSSAPHRAALRGVAWLVAAVAWAFAAAVGAVLAVVFATSMVVIGLMASVFLAVSAAALRARRSVRAAAGPDVIEARNVGGHSWVAYGWDQRR